MTRRILTAAVGGAAGAVAVVVATWVSPWRPTGWWVAAAIVLLAVPTMVAGGTWTTMRVLSEDDRPWHTARLAAVGAPVLALFALFVVVAAAGPDSMGAQQSVALVVGGATAAALAARFTPDGSDGSMD